MNAQYRRIKNLFLQQSYLDTWDDYVRSLRKASFIKWDYLVLTASNEDQAQSYRQQIERRLRAGRLPEKTEYVVLADPEGKRVGSGGATLNVLSHVAAREAERAAREAVGAAEAAQKTAEAAQKTAVPAGASRSGENPFAGKRILVIHSGGDSKRAPQYSACGKLFSPVPRELPDGRPSTLFDELVIGMSGIPSRIRDGMLVLSGDVLLLFNPLQIDFQFVGAAGITMKMPVRIGKNHGVYLSDGKNHVRSFLHKQSEERLAALGAVDEQGAVDLDTGAVLLDGALLRALYSLICTDGRPDGERFARFVNEKARISFYGDFLYPLGREASLEDYYLQEPEGSFTPELLACRTEIWDALHSFSMGLCSVSPAEFIHFGTTRELLALVTENIEDYEYLGWQRLVTSTVGGKEDFASNNSVIENAASLGAGVYAEDSFVGGGAAIGAGSIVSSVRLEDETVPPGCALSGVWLKTGGCAVRVYGISDNPKGTLAGGTPFLYGSLAGFLEKNGLEEDDLWRTSDRSLWTAELYPVGEDMRQAVAHALTVCRMSRGEASAEEIAGWRRMRRESLHSSFERADSRRLIEWREHLRDHILVRKFIDALLRGEDYQDALHVFGEGQISGVQYRLLLDAAGNSGFFEKIRILYSLSRYMKKQNREYDGVSYDKIESMCFREIQDVVCSANTAGLAAGKRFKAVKDEVNVKLPVRVNWGGGWTDTPPYCNEHGGVVLNAAISLNGILPVQVCVRRLEDFCVEFESQDVGAFGRVESLEEIQNCHDPFDPFALHKAALLTYGIVPMEGSASLEEILKEMGGGLYLSTQVVGVPKGSGLGTSSILAGACIRALAEFVGEELSYNDIYDKVLCMEQLMSTGGGWQDQVGGVTPGIKYITTRPGIEQKIQVTQVELSDAAKRELQERFALIYTGQRRLARNLLRKVVGGYLSGRRDSILALKNMPELAVLMKFELERGDIDAFAGLLNRHWLLSQQLDAGSTNTCIDQIFLACEDLIDGRFIAGAGGGGFLMVILKKGITKQQLRQRLHEVFQDSGVDVWDSEFVYA